MIGLFLAYLVVGLSVTFMAFATGDKRNIRKASLKMTLFWPKELPVIFARMGKELSDIYKKD